MTLAEAVLQSNRLALSRLLTQIENDTPQGREALNQLFPYTGKAHLVGVTGAPGTGKSTLVNALALYFRQDFEPQRRVGIVAVDPSSPFTGGAILGDRVRMRDLAGDPGVFIRSMASRGSLGGLARTTAGVVQALDAAGFDLILIETVGAGQAEVEIARLAHTTLVIEAPGLGDDIQAIKAGILEIADLLVINKADRPGVEITERALRSNLQLGHPTRSFGRQPSQSGAGGLGSEDVASETALWMPPIQRTVATEMQGIAELAHLILEHYRYLQASGELQQRERERLQTELDGLLRETLMARWRERVTDGEYRRALNELVQRRVSPWQAVTRLLAEGTHGGN